MQIRLALLPICGCKIEKIIGLSLIKNYVSQHLLLFDSVLSIRTKAEDVNKSALSEASKPPRLSDFTEMSLSIGLPRFARAVDNA